MPDTRYDYLVVGSGFFGATFAWYATLAGRSCLVVESRNHIGGNCYTENIEGINVHKYGPHIFHTSDKNIWDFVNQFATFNTYTHRVKAVNEKIYSLPFNLNTINSIDKSVKDPEAAKKWIQENQLRIESTNLEEHCLSMIGKELYEKFVRDYTIKQWGRDPKTLPASLIKRLPIRTTFDDNYFNDTYQGIPIGGYTQIFEKLLSKSTVITNVDYFHEKNELNSLANKTIYTGPIDRFYDYKFGNLEYRTLDFHHVQHNLEYYQGCAQINYTSLNEPYTRIIEHKHFERCNVKNKTIITYEIPREWKQGDIQYYPIPNTKNLSTAELYLRESKLEKTVLFGGRLGTYKYYDMHQVIAAAMTMAKNEKLLK